MEHVFVHIVSYNPKPSLREAIRAVLAQESDGLFSLELLVTDNNSTNGVFEATVPEYRGSVKFAKNPQNLGFCGAHNQGVAEFLDGKAEYLLILNPDLKLHPRAILELISGMKEKGAGLSCPKLLRADAELNEISPPTLDAAGMCLTASLRHFDRGSEELDKGQFSKSELVFGGSGAALMLTRESCRRLLLARGPFEDDLFSIYPELRDGADTRPQLFDEAFFAYREDADLAWRAKNREVSCVYVAAALGWHERVVTPERRSTLPARLNALSVRNRFLLQFNNYSICDFPSAFLPGVVFRNLLVLAGVVLRERTSLTALCQAFKLRRRAFWNRKFGPSQ